MSKTLMQERKTREEPVVAKLKPTMILVSKSVNRSPTLDSGVPYSLGNYGMQSQNSDRSTIEKWKAKIKDRKVDPSQLRKYSRMYDKS